MNPITDLTGPQFLVFYAILIVVTVVLCRRRRRSSDISAALPVPSLPEHFDPYEIAYLRGGDNEVARAAAVRLTEMGYLLLADKRIVAGTDHPPLEDLSGLERCVFDWFAPGRKAKAAFANSDLSAMLRSHTLPYQEKLHGEYMLADADTVATPFAAAALAVVAVIGILRLFVGLTRDRPVGFLILMGIAGLIATYLVSRQSRLSARGKAYLAALQKKWERPAQPVVAGADDSWMMTSLFGAGILAGTPYEDLGDTSKKHDSSDSGAAIYGGDGGGGSDGGGGGGDGGGGGCGGGCGGCGGGS